MSMVLRFSDYEPARRGPEQRHPEPAVVIILPQIVVERRPIREDDGLPSDSQG